MIKKISHLLPLGIFVLSLIVLFLYFKFCSTGYLNFSDAAKSADIARNLITGLGYNGNFSFWGSSIVDLMQKAAFPSPWLPPAVPFSIALGFKIFGVTDAVVMGVSSSYFVLLVFFVFLLGKNIFGKLVGALSAIALAVNIDFLNYATNGSTETLFTLEIVISMYLVSLRKKWAIITTFVFAFLMYFTRPQAFIYIAGLLLYWLLVNFNLKKAIMYFMAISMIWLLVDYFVLPNFAGQYFLYSVTGRGIGTATEVVAGGSASDSLRGVTVGTTLNILSVGKKIFYNLYNFYKLMPQIVNPYLFALFVIGLFYWSKKKIINSFKVSAIFMILVTFLVTATSIPFFRYIHPVIPFIYIFAISTLVEIINFKKISQKYKVLISLVIVTIFTVGQTLGVILLDSRFQKNTHNINKPPVYVVLSKLLKENTKATDFVVTNLDTWGSWYGERRTIWFPIEPRFLINAETGKIPFDAIYLTSYLINDQNYYMSDSWRMIFDNPTNTDKWICDGCSQIAKEYKVKEIFLVVPDENYEKQNARSVLFVKK